MAVLKIILQYGFTTVYSKRQIQSINQCTESKTKSLRQWRFTSKDEIDEKKILEIHQRSHRNREKGLKIMPEKFKAVPLSQLLVDAFSRQ
jgi:hypothetical protein